MKFFLKLNVISTVYAILMFVPVELMNNVYRIIRLTNWKSGTFYTLFFVTFLIEIVLGTILLLFLTNMWMGRRKAIFWTVILWVPYFFLFVYLFESLFPITYGGDTTNPVTGFLLIGGMIVHPIYILIINLTGMSGNSENKG